MKTVLAWAGLVLLLGPSAVAGQAVPPRVLPHPVVEDMLDLAAITADDRVIDLGSGDGRTVVAAATRRAHVTGVEADAAAAAVARNNVERWRASLFQFNTFAGIVPAVPKHADMMSATVITISSASVIDRDLKATLLSLTPGTRITSMFPLGDWQPDESRRVEAGCDPPCTVHLWIVPADFSGRWDLPAGPLVIEQRFQKIRGTLTDQLTGTVRPLLDATVRGNQLRFRIAMADQHVEYRARLVRPGILAGSAGGIPNDGAGIVWRADRSATIPVIPPPPK